jgi:hypothetical protein
VRAGRVRALFATAGAAALAAGCGLGPGRDEGGASLVVTRDFGARQVGAVRADRVPGSETVMRFLQRNFSVQTRYGGGFVQSINGLSGTTGDGRRVDWFYYVNGIEASKGAAATRVHSGDRVWWDRHDWSGAQRVPAVVGSYPEPFRSGSGGRRLPVRVDCAREAAEACRLVRERLSEAGVPGASAALGAASGEEILRILVGEWRAVRTDPSARQIEEGPGSSGVFARFEGSGRRLVLLDAAGRPAQSFRDGAGLVAATRLADQEPTWVVTGVDRAGVLSAARSLSRQALANRFAVVTRLDARRPAPAEGAAG